jgi:hypothetical protein
VDNLSVLADKSVLVVFTYAQAGLGHLRVTDALSNGLPRAVTPVLLGAYDTTIASLHRFISIHSVTNNIMEWAQRGAPQNFFTYMYRRYLRMHTEVLYEEMRSVLKQRIDVPKKVIVVATHFALAHQLAVVKQKLEHEEKVKIMLFVQVTDDSPQHMWYVPGADYIFVPSYRTKKELDHYSERFPSHERAHIEVLPYPISPILAKCLPEERYKNRINQLDKIWNKEINISVPISGAAVHMDFTNTLINELHRKSQHFVFHIVANQAPFTLEFLRKYKHKSWVKLYTSTHARETVDLYDKLYKETVISLEVTKPSEQAFKALFKTDQYGGSVLLFSKPVGRQEYDNLDFLKRHGLIFSTSERDMLWSKAAKNESLGELGLIRLFEDKVKLRGVELPYDPREASHFIWWCLQQGILQKIAEHGNIGYNLSNIETWSNGVELFWHRVASLFH